MSTQRSADNLDPTLFIGGPLDMQVHCVEVGVTEILVTCTLPQRAECEPTLHPARVEMDEPFLKRRYNETYLVHPERGVAQRVFLCEGVNEGWALSQSLARWREHANAKCFPSWNQPSHSLETA